MRALQNLLLLVIAAAAGFGTSELLFRLGAAQELMRHLFPNEEENSVQLLARAAAGETVSESAVDAEVSLLRSQFADDGAFTNALASARLPLPVLRREITDHLRARQWIERQIAPELVVSDAEGRANYAASPARFTQPQRYRASHIFIAAPDGTAPETVLEKRTAVQGLAIRLLAGENFADLVSEGSEDEATKSRAGDLDYFSAARMPLEFMAEVEKLAPGQNSAPVQSHLGFHILHLSEVLPPRLMPFEEVNWEITQALANEKRAVAVVGITQTLKQPD